MPTLIVRNLSKTYGQRQVVSNVSLTVSRGEIIGLLWPNGAGNGVRFAELRHRDVSRTGRCDEADASLFDIGGPFTGALAIEEVVADAHGGLLSVPDAGCSGLPDPYGDELHGQVLNGNTQTADLIFNADIPLLRGAGMVAREDLIQAERNMVYAARDFERFRRTFLFDITTEFLNLVVLQLAIGNGSLRTGAPEKTTEIAERAPEGERFQGLMLQRTNTSEEILQLLPVGKSTPECEGRLSR